VTRKRKSESLSPLATLLPPTRMPPLATLAIATNANPSVGTTASTTRTCSSPSSGQKKKSRNHNTSANQESSSSSSEIVTKKKQKKKKKKKKKKGKNQKGQEKQSDSSSEERPQGIALKDGSSTILQASFTKKSTSQVPIMVRLPQKSSSKNVVSS
jgi:hypothetical protein